MEEKKNNKGLVWLIVILIILVLGLVGYIIYDKTIKDDNQLLNNNTTTTTTKVETNIPEIYEGIYIDESIEDDEIRNAYALISNLGFMTSGYEWNFGNKTKLLFDDLSEEEKMKMIFVNLVINKKVKYDSMTVDGYKYIILSEDLENAVKDVFGNNTFEFNKDFTHNSCTLTLNDENGYDVECYGAGREDDSEDYLIYDMKKNNNTIEINVAYYYEIFEHAGDNPGIYYNTEMLEEKICNSDEVENNINKLQQYKFTFVNDGNNYIFDNIELINY